MSVRDLGEDYVHDVLGLARDALDHIFAQLGHAFFGNIADYALDEALYLFGLRHGLEDPLPDVVAPG